MKDKMKGQKWLFFLLFILSFLQFSFWGFKYFATLDDNNQLGIYNLRNDNLMENVIEHYKSYNVRPLAFFTDTFVFSWFWNNTYLLFLAILIMHALIAVLIYKIAQLIKINIGPLAITLIFLSPVLLEGLYWISASTRIVVSVFLTILSIYLLLKSFDEKCKKKRIAELALAIIVDLISVGYYEQTVAINLFLYAFVLILKKKKKFMFIPIVSTVWIGAWYVYFILNNQAAQREHFDLLGIFNNLASTIASATELLIQIAKNSIHWFESSLNSAFSNPVTLVILIAFVVFCYFLYTQREELLKKPEESHNVLKLTLGLIFVIVPVLPFSIITDVVFAYRNLYIPMIGFAIIAEVILDLLLKPLKSEKLSCGIRTCLICIFAFYAIFANIGGVKNYKIVNELDNKIIGEIIDNIDNDLESSISVSINYDVNELKNLKGEYNPNRCAIEVYWGVLGKVQILKNKYFDDKSKVWKVYINSNSDSADYVFRIDAYGNVINESK